MSVWNRLRGDTFSGEEQHARAAAIEPDGSHFADAQIPGDRNVSPTHRARSAQSHLTHMLALGMGGLVIGGFLIWYYKNALAEHSRERESALAATAKKAQGDMILPALGRIDPPLVERVLGPPPPLPQDSSAVPVAQHEWRPSSEGMPSAHGVNSSSTPQPDASVERRLGGPAFIAASLRGVNGSTSAAAHDALPANLRPSALELGSSERGDLAALLEPTATPAAHAKVLPTRRLLLAKGTFLDCTLETAIDSSLPGMTTCITATDTFGVDGSVVLLERGTKLIGETRGEVRQGSRRLFVLWTEARTPTGVVVPLASPGTDELGRSGLSGDVNRHFWDRFGAAILISIIDGAIQGAVQRSNDGGTVIVNPSGSRDIMTEVLKSTIHIPPTLTKKNGDRIAVLVARDLDFRSVYELRPASLTE